MRKEDVIARLRAHERELKEAGVMHLRLHGSVARGDAGPASDVDLIAKFDKAKRLSLIDVVGIQNRLADILGMPVDLSQEDMLKEPVRLKAEREAVLAF